ncbi:hypothetical protein IQ249_24090 [Lusitaniella coriacea LEGE 07157]|uniref:Uncharacterized protein n=1 Tax=Lusitaniella coriacea LEGE 07157 TaxID=945747 RepID=A0A8J7JEX2_9CYAN|nr:hypothetical protein [Lusitaniella coriacea]MBE9118975.1 hypothetical protein [Lusitaniella coriacea LEGE 07157]
MKSAQNKTWVQELTPKESSAINGGYCPYSNSYGSSERSVLYRSASTSPTSYRPRYNPVYA